jgi:hypothetical protein
MPAGSRADCGRLCHGLAVVMTIVVCPAIPVMRVMLVTIEGEVEDDPQNTLVDDAAPDPQTAPSAQPVATARSTSSNRSHQSTYGAKQVRMTLGDPSLRPSSSSLRSPPSMHSFCMRNQTTWCAPPAASTLTTPINQNP